MQSNVTNPGPKALLADAPSPDNPQPPLVKQENALALASSLGVLDVRTPEEEVEFRECEAMVREGWTRLALAGEALARIREKRLYKNEYPTFEIYCQERWGFGYTQAWRYIASAEVQKALGSVPGIPLPECEAQVRPLIGLPAELAIQAWVNALSWSRDGQVPARLVKRAVKQAVRTEQPAVLAASKADKQQRYRWRQSVRAGFQELLTMLMGSAERAALIAKVQEIERLLDPILNPKKKRA